MNNKEFLNTLRICRNINNIENIIIKKLEDSELNISELYRIYNSYIKDIKALFNLFLILDEGYGLNGKDRFLDNFLEITKLQAQYNNTDIFKDIKYNVVFGHYHSELNISKDLRSLRIIWVRYNKEVILDKKTVLVKRVHQENGIEALKIKNDYFGGILIKDNNIEYIKIYSIQDEVNLLDRVLNDNYDICILPILYDLNDNIMRLYDKIAYNKDYLELYSSLLRGSIDRELYWNIYNSKINLSKLIRFFVYNIGGTNEWLRLLNTISKKIENKGLSGEEIDNYSTSLIDVFNKKEYIDKDALKNLNLYLTLYKNIDIHNLSKVIDMVVPNH